MLNYAVDQQFSRDKLNIAGGELARKIISPGCFDRIEVLYAQVKDALADAFLDRVHYPGVVGDLNGVGVLGWRWFSDGILFDYGVGQQPLADCFQFFSA